jgi:hypothetical protein
MKKVWISNPDLDVSISIRVPYRFPNFTNGII